MDEALALGISRKMMAGMGGGWEESMKRIEEKLSVKKAGHPPSYCPVQGGLWPRRWPSHIGTIHKAIMNFQRVKMTYRPLYSDEKTKRKVDPYYLFFEDDFWYFRGYCHLREEVRTFALDRIMALKVLVGTFHSPGTLLRRRNCPGPLEPWWTGNR